MQRKVTKLILRPFNATGNGTMNFNLNVGDTFIELDAGELEPPLPGYIFGSAWGNHMWVPEDSLSAP
jgi:hypothetical protein